jgi:hypothetical protein
MTAICARLPFPKLCLGEKSIKFFRIEETWFFKGLSKVASRMEFHSVWSAALDNPWDQIVQFQPILFSNSIHPTSLLSLFPSSCFHWIMIHTFRCPAPWVWRWIPRTGWGTKLFLIHHALLDCPWGHLFIQEFGVLFTEIFTRPWGRKIQHRHQPHGTFPVGPHAFGNAPCDHVIQDSSSIAGN